MKSILHRSDSRGHADHGWLDSHHSFSFADYYNPGRMNFGKLRVLNDDIVSGGMGFAMHFHENMEIVSIPLSGSLEHRDNIGNQGVIKKGEVQIMSAGIGIRHSEFNHSKTDPVNFLQIWILPNQHEINSRYDQKFFNAEDRKNKFQTLISPIHGNGMLINQDAWLSMADIDKGKQLDYRIHRNGNGAYVFLISGHIIAGDQTLMPKDAAGISETDEFKITAVEDAEVLIIEVPME